MAGIKYRKLNTLHDAKNKQLLWKGQATIQQPKLTWNSLSSKIMKKLLLPNSAFLGLAVSHRQNLIPNSSFENFTGCPSNTEQLYVVEIK